MQQQHKGDFSLNVSHYLGSIASPDPYRVVSTDNAIGFNLQQVTALDPAKRKRERLNLVAYALYRAQDVTGAISLKAAVSWCPALRFGVSAGHRGAFERGRGKFRRRAGGRARRARPCHPLRSDDTVWESHSIAAWSPKAAERN
jgi:hypothetical protein